MYLKGIRSGLEIMVPGLSCFYDGQHLLVVNRIISFGGVMECDMYAMGLNSLSSHLTLITPLTANSDASVLRRNS